MLILLIQNFYWSSELVRTFIEEVHLYAYINQCLLQKQPEVSVAYNHIYF